MTVIVWESDNAPHGFRYCARYCVLGGNDLFTDPPNKKLPKAELERITEANRAAGIMYVTPSPTGAGLQIYGDFRENQQGPGNWHTTDFICWTSTTGLIQRTAYSENRDAAIAQANAIWQGYLNEYRAKLEKRKKRGAKGQPVDDDGDQPETLEAD